MLLLAGCQDAGQSPPSIATAAAPTKVGPTPTVIPEEAEPGPAGNRLEDAPTATAVLGGAEPTPTVIPAVGEPEPSDFEQMVSGNYLLAVAAAESVRGLSRNPPVPLVVTVEEATELVNSYLSEQDPGEVVSRDQVLQALGVLAPGRSLDDVYLEQVPAQLLGFYVSDDDRLYLVESADPAREAQILLTITHEYVHALQQSNFDISTLSNSIPLLQFDRQLALSALIEGEASVFGLVAATQLVELADLLAAPVPPPGPLDRAGQYVQSVLIYPYETGAQFVLAVLGRGGIEALNALYEPQRVPQSTAQIAQLLATGQGDWQEIAPDSDLADFGDPEIPCWQVTGEGALGQFALGVLFANRSGSRTPGPIGWLDDHLVLIGNGQNSALLLRTAFADPRAAADFHHTMLDFVSQNRLDHAYGEGRFEVVSPTEAIWQGGPKAALIGISGTRVSLVVGDHQPAVEAAYATLAQGPASGLNAAQFCPATS